MRATVRAVVLFASVTLAAVAAGCGSTSIGQPCLPAPPPLSGASGEPTCGAGGCFAGSEVYIETRSLQCATRVCLVYKWNQRIEPDKRPERVFCTCRCDGEGDPSSFCTCPEQFSCTNVFVAGNPGIRGSYCIRSSIVGTGDGGMAGAM